MELSIAFNIILSPKNLVAYEVTHFSKMVEGESTVSQTISTFFGHIVSKFSYALMVEYTCPLKSSVVRDPIPTMTHFCLLPLLSTV